MPVPFNTTAIPTGAPEDLDRSDSATEASKQLAISAPWDLTEHDMWRLDVPHLYRTINRMELHTSLRMTTEAEAKVISMSKWLLEKRKAEFRAQQVVAQIAMRDLARQA